MYKVGGPRQPGATRRGGGPVPVDACHASADAMDSAGVSTTGENTTHVAGTSIRGRCSAHQPMAGDEKAQKVVGHLMQRYGQDNLLV